MRIVIALGGNALSPPDAPLDFPTQQQSAHRAAEQLAPILEHHQVVITHGNGPQVGLLALQSGSNGDGATYPLDVLVAETEGMIGYVLQTEIDRVFDGDTLAVLTRTIVDPDDPAFRWPTKPIGPVYQNVDAAQLMAGERGWVLASEGNGARRVVPSPEPRGVVEAGLIRRLVEQDVLVICAGGGGVPVTDERRGVCGIEAVVDKDLASALLARLVGADRFVSLTDVDAVVDGWGTSTARPLLHASPEELRLRRFADGSMGPKVEAACRFVERTGGSAAIGSLWNATQVVEGVSGTQVDMRPGYDLAAVAAW